MFDRSPIVSGCLPVLLAGGRGSRLHELTATECKPAVPFGPAGGRIVDFVLGATRAAGFDRLLVATQYRPASLSRYLLHNWAPAFPGGIRLRDGNGLPEGYRGTLDVLGANLAELDRLAPAEVLVLAGDHVFDMDLAVFVAAHRASGAAATVAATPVARNEARGFGVFRLDGAGRATGFAEKPDDPAPMPGRPDHSLASMGIYVFDWRWLQAALRAEAHNPATRHDFGHDLLPAALAGGELAVHVLPPRNDGRPGYWRDVGTLDSYRLAQLDLAAPGAPLRQPLPPWPERRIPAFWPGLAAAGGSLCESVLLPGASVGRGCRLSRTIVGPDARLPDGLVVGEDMAEDCRWFRRTAGGTTLVTAPMLERRAAGQERPPQGAPAPARAGLG